MLKISSFETTAPSQSRNQVAIYIEFLFTYIKLTYLEFPHIMMKFFVFKKLEISRPKCNGHSKIINGTQKVISTDTLFLKNEIQYTTYEPEICNLIFSRGSHRRCYGSKH